MGQARFLEYLIAKGIEWVHEQRNTHRPTGRVLSPPERAALAPFFPAEVLADIRLVSIPMIQNPPFYAELARVGLSMPPDFRAMAGITFQDTIVISQSAPCPNYTQLLFHEAVHVVQYRLLGLQTFVRDYVLGWAGAGFQYLGIPLEIDAHQLDNHFVTSPGVVFDVVAELRHRLGARGAAG